MNSEGTSEGMWVVFILPIIILGFISYLFVSMAAVECSPCHYITFQDSMRDTNFVRPSDLAIIDSTGKVYEVDFGAFDGSPKQMETEYMIKHLKPGQRIYVRTYRSYLQFCEGGT